MKKIYKKIEIQIITFEIDIIATSDVLPFPGSDGDNLPSVPMVWG